MESAATTTELSIVIFMSQLSKDSTVLWIMFHFLTGTLESHLVGSTEGLIQGNSPALLLSVPSGERHLFPPCARHTGHCGLGRTLQLLGQRRPHKVKDLRAAGPADHGVLLQPQRQHLCIRLQLRLVKGGSLLVVRCSSGCAPALIFPV